MATGAILIVDLGFQPDQLRSVIGRLEKAGFRYVLFKTPGKLREALSTPDNKLLLAGATSDSLPALRAQLQETARGPATIPVLVCFTHPTSHIKDDELTAPEIDDFCLAPINPDDVLLRVRRLWQRCGVNHDEFGQGEFGTDFILQDEFERVKHTSMNHFGDHSGLRRIIGQAPAFAAIKKQILRLAACDVTILITGQTGTGKEMCARAIHYLSPRANGPFVPVNCSAIPTELFENELFGHEPGAYTDARQRRHGLIAEAEGGTFFLDEIDSLHPLAQVKLLRFLQDRRYKPLGATNYKQVNTRLLAASNQNLRAKVKEGSFREDLYFRIKIVSLSLPPLCERREDIPSLAFHFLEVAAQEYRRTGLRFTRDALQKLSHYAWPGNVRELENVVRQAVVLAEGPVISARDLKFPSEDDGYSYSAGEPFNEAKARMIAAFERDYLQQALSATGGNISRAAQYAQKDRRTFFGLLKKHGLSHLNKSSTEKLTGAAPRV